jgi:hypothetical protein
MRHPVDADGIEMSREEKCRRFRTTQVSDDVLPAVGDILQSHSESPTLQNTRKEPRCLGLARTVGVD